MDRLTVRHAVCILLLVVAPLARADQITDTADLVGILRALHDDRCGLTSWKSPPDPLVISDRPSAPQVDMKSRRPVTMFDLDLVPRAPPGTLWPQVTLCPGVGVVDHTRLERLVRRFEGLPSDPHAFAFAFGGARSYVTITLPAFSADGNRAVVYREHLCGLCGDGTYFELVRTRTGWKISRYRLVWIS